jgi:hypothetical protein
MMIKSLETEAKTGSVLPIGDIRALPIKECSGYQTEKGLSTYGPVEYSCDAVCDNCHCATY